MPKAPQRRPRFSARVASAYASAALPRTLAIVASEGAATEILLYDEIGAWGVTAKDFAAALARAGDGPIHLRVNSPGGDVFDAMAIYNCLRAHKSPVAVTIDGLAASAASYVAMGGSRLAMAGKAMMMIHNAWGGCLGDRNDMAEMAGVLGKVDGVIASIYAERTGKGAPDIAALMDSETWMTSEEARAAGFCDEIAGAPPKARLAAAARIRIRAALPAYDPDGDGDNDAQEALDSVAMAASHLENARRALSGEGGDDESDDDGDDGMRPSDRARRVPRNAATEPEWQVGAAEDLPIDSSESWDGPAAAERMLEAAGFNGASPDPAKAKTGFLVWDHHNPKLKGSYKEPFADIVGAEKKAVRGGIRAAASRLPQTDIPDAAKYRARAVIDAYEKRMAADDSAKSARARRLRLAGADA